MTSVSGRPTHRLTVLLEGDGRAAALVRLLEYLIAQDVEVERVGFAPSPTPRLFEVRLDVFLRAGRITTLLRNLADEEEVASISAENLSSRATFILPV